jgi:hypothetical protein
MKTRLMRIVGLGAVLAALLVIPASTHAQEGILCTSNAQCPTGTLCCYPCGTDGCHDMCIKPLNGHCPHFP